MKSKFGGALILLSMLAFARARKVNDPTEVQAIKKTVEEYVKAMNAGDAGAVAALMTDKTAYASKKVPVAIGAEAIRSAFQAFCSLDWCYSTLAVRASAGENNASRRFAFPGETHP